MIHGPKFKLARRLGAPIFEKTQTEKYAISLARKEKAGTVPRRPKSEYGLQLIEKQKARFSYGLSEKQFRKYVNNALTATEPLQKLFSNLEKRLDNVLYRSGIAKSRAQARQMASHGLATVNGRKVTIPSMELKVGDVVGIREGRIQSPLFAEVSERMKAMTTGTWFKVDSDKKTVEVTGAPAYVPGDQVFDLGAVIEFYNR